MKQKNISDNLNISKKNKKEQISSGKVSEEIKKCLLNMEAIFEVSPIMTNGMYEHRMGKDYSFYTIKNGRKQFTITVSDNT